jgi:hypothetical protein
MLTALSECQLDLDGPVLDRWGEVLDRHSCQWRSVVGEPQIAHRARREANFEPSDRADPDQSTLDPGRPLFGIWASGEPDQSGLVNKPGNCSPAWGPLS